MHARYSLIVGVVSALMSANAQAADMPVKRRAPVATVAPVVAAYDWTGAYIGLHAGGGWARSQFFDVSAPTITRRREEGDVNSDGFLGGGQLGYNFQTGPLVLGVEAQGSFAGLSGSSRDDVHSFLQIHSDIEWLATLAGRAGIAHDNWLWFGKVGVAWADSSFRFVTVPAGRSFVSHSAVRVGWMVGAGVEYGLAPNWSAKIEYNYLDFGSETWAVLCPCPFGQREDQREHLVMAGFNFRFPAR